MRIYRTLSFILKTKDVKTFILKSFQKHDDENGGEHHRHLQRRRREEIRHHRGEHGMDDEERRTDDDASVRVDRVCNLVHPLLGPRESGLGDYRHVQGEYSGDV